MVSTSDFDSGDQGSIPCRTFLFWLRLLLSEGAGRRAKSGNTLLGSHYVFNFWKHEFAGTGFEFNSWEHIKHSPDAFLLILFTFVAFALCAVARLMNSRRDDLKWAHSRKGIMWITPCWSSTTYVFFFEKLVVRNQQTIPRSWDPYCLS